MSDASSTNRQSLDCSVFNQIIRSGGSVSSWKETRDRFQFTHTRHTQNMHLCKNQQQGINDLRDKAQSAFYTIKDIKIDMPIRI